MQTKTITGIAATSQVLDETSLGFDPNAYSYFYIQVLGADTETWLIQVLTAGSLQYSEIVGLPTTEAPIPGIMAVTPDHVGNVEAFKVVFAGGTPSAATIMVVAMNRPGLGQR